MLQFGKYNLRMLINGNDTGTIIKENMARYRKKFFIKNSNS